MSADGNATTWRDLADQLTPGQIAELEYCEQPGTPPGIADAEFHLARARRFAGLNIVQAMFADIAAACRCF